MNISRWFTNFTKMMFEDERIVEKLVRVKILSIKCITTNIIIEDETIVWVITRYRFFFWTMEWPLSCQSLKAAQNFTNILKTKYGVVRTKTCMFMKRSSFYLKYRNNRLFYPEIRELFDRTADKCEKLDQYVENEDKETSEMK